MTAAPGLTLRDILNVIYKRILILKLVVILVPIGVFIGCLLATPVYQVGAKVVVTAKKDDPSLLVGSSPGASRILNLNVDEIDLNTEMEILKSPELWLRTVRKLGFGFFQGESAGVVGKIFGVISSSISGLFASKEDVKKADSQEYSRDIAIAYGLMSRFEVTPVARSKVLDVSFKDSNPDKIQKILSTLLAVYIPFHSEVYSLPGIQGFFAEQLAAAKEKFHQTRHKPTQFKKESNLSIPDRQEQDILATRKMIEDALIDVNSTIKQYSKMSSLLNQRNLPTGQLAPSAVRSAESTLINVLAVQLVQSEQKLIQLGEVWNKNSRDYFAGSDQLKDSFDRFTSAISSEISVLEIKKASLEESRNRVLTQMDLMAQKSEEFRAIQLELSVAREQYLQFVGKEQAARIDAEESRQKLVDIKILGEPSRPTRPISPKTGTYVFLAFVFSFPLGIGIIFVASFLDHSFDDPSRLEAATGYKVLASFGKVKKDKPPEDAK